MKALIITLFSLFLVGCQSNSEAKTLDELFTKKVNGKVAKLSIPSDDLPNISGKLLIFGKHLIVKQLNQSKVLSVFDLEKEAKAYDLFNSGRGHKELTYVSSVDIDNNGLILGQGNRFIVIDSLYKKCDKGEWKIINPESLDHVNRITKLNNEFYVITGSCGGSKKQFSLLDKDLNIVQHFDDYPIKDTDNYTSVDLAMAIQGRLSSCENAFVFASSYGYILKFFKLEDSKVAKQKEYVFKVPKFKVIDNGIVQAVAQDSNNPVGAITATSSKDTYFLLYGIGAIKDKQSGGNIIYCFNHKGEPKQKIVFDANLKQIAYSEEYNCLFGLGEDEDGEMYICKITF
ncbi:MAG: BF3164 family lipoprotein [Rikenellaceae bacterium]